jgi:hypothetical protein
MEAPKEEDEDYDEANCDEHSQTSHEELISFKKPQ